MGFIPAFLMLRNVYIEVIRWCPQPQVTAYFDKHWYDNSIYHLTVHLFVDIWAYSITLVKIPPWALPPPLRKLPPNAWPCTSTPPKKKPNPNHTLSKTRFSRRNSTWGRSSEGNFVREGEDFPDASLNENILNVVANFSKAETLT